MSRRPERLYFAYGSNLWLEQMATRCPDSIYIGRASLPDHIWQINERGFANVVARPGSNVHGLVYQVSAADEVRLDRFEGTRNGAYSKRAKTVILSPAPKRLVTRTANLVEDGSAELSTQDRLLQEELRVVPNVLVYLSEAFITWGTAREEYTHRINNGIRDAIGLGVPSEFFENAVRPSIPARRIDRSRVRTQTAAAAAAAAAVTTRPANTRRIEQRRRASTSPEPRGRRLTRRVESPIRVYEAGGPRWATETRESWYPGGVFSYEYYRPTTR